MSFGISPSGIVSLGTKEAVVSGNVTGTLNVTLGDCTSTAVGTATHTGTLDVTLDNVSITAVGTANHTGTLNVTLGLVTLAGVGIIETDSNPGDIIPSDTSDVDVLLRLIYVGGSGNIKIKTAANEDADFAGVPIGIFNPGCRVKRVFETGTTATNLIGIL
ncbi:MAG: hypothetical protein V3T88_02385 [Nitrosomonadaceae bacterium]